MNDQRTGVVFCCTEKSFLAVDGLRTKPLEWVQYLGVSFLLSGAKGGGENISWRIFVIFNSNKAALEALIG